MLKGCSGDQCDDKDRSDRDSLNLKEVPNSGFAEIIERGSADFIRVSSRFRSCLKTGYIAAIVLSVMKYKAWQTGGAHIYFLNDAVVTVTAIPSRTAAGNNSRLG